MKKSIRLMFFLLIFCLITSSAFASDISSIPALTSITNYITKMTINVNKSVSQLQKIADMLICYSLHGESSYIDAPTVLGKTLDLSLHLFNPVFFITGVVSYVLAFFVLMISIFYMFDIAFNICVTLLILPLGLALWPFGWTKDKLKVMIESIAYYTGVFIFLPLGILISVRIVEASTSWNGDIELFYREDNADAMSEAFGLSSLGFLKIILAYVVAIRIVPLLADEFCTHFFGHSLLGNPIHEKAAEFAKNFKQRTIDRVWNYGKNVARHSVGEHIKKSGDKNGGFLDRAVYRYGKNVGKAK